MRASAPAFRHEYLGCEDCGSVYRLYPERVDDEDEGSDPEAFLAAHAGHHIEPLTRGDTILANGPLWDPMATTFVEVTDGSRVWVVRSSRASIDEPLVRHLIPGRLRLRETTVDIDADLFRRALDAHFYPHALRPSKVKRLVDTVREAVRQLDPERLDILYDATDDPQTSFARLPDAIRTGIVSQCAAVFEGFELDRLRDFVTSDGDADGALTLIVRRHFEVEKT